MHSTLRIVGLCFLLGVCASYTLAQTELVLQWCDHSLPVTCNGTCTPVQCHQVVGPGGQTCNAAGSGGTCVFLAANICWKQTACPGLCGSSTTVCNCTSSPFC